MASYIPPKPDFATMEAAAPKTADRRTFILALIGNLVFSWSNNESLFIYVLMQLLRTDQASAVIVFATLNTTRARLELIQRLAKIRIKDRAIEKQLEKLIDRFNECTRVRNEFNHCMYSLGPGGEITHTQSLRIVQTRGRLSLGETKPIDDARIKEMTKVTHELKDLNRDMWDFLPRLGEHLDEMRRKASKAPTKPATK